ncbi:MAG: efflux RND transporter periplasmic adaptor subunit [Calditrichaceae bacterium]
MKILMNWRIKLMMTILFVISIIFSGCKKENSEITHPPVAVRVIKPMHKNMNKVLSYMGTVHSESEVKVTAQVQGTIASLRYPEGARIQKGDMIAKIYAPDLDAAVERTKADSDYWTRRYETDKRLVEAKAIPPEEGEASKRAYLAANAAYTEAKSRLEKTIEKSPINGEVLDWLVEPGQNVMPGQPILLLGNNKLELHAEVVEEDLRRGIRGGISALVTENDGTKFETKVSEVSPVASGTSRAFIVKTPLRSGDGQNLRKGASLRVDYILDSSKDAIVVPVQAIANRDKNPHLFVISDGLAFRRDVKLGIEQDGWIAVSMDGTGIETVAMSNLGSLKDSVRVFAVELEEVQR